MFIMLQSRHNLYGEIDDDQDIEIENSMFGQQEDQLSNDSFTREFYQKMRTNKQKKAEKIPKKQNFNYLQITTADQIKHLIEKCQDSLDEDFVNLYKSRKIIEKLIKNKFGEEADHDQSPIKNEFVNDDSQIDDQELDEKSGNCI